MRAMDFSQTHAQWAGLWYCTSWACLQLAGARVLIWEKKTSECIDTVPYSRVISPWFSLSVCLSFPQTYFFSLRKLLSFSSVSICFTECFLVLPVTQLPSSKCYIWYNPVTKNTEFSPFVVKKMFSHVLDGSMHL